MAFCKSQKQQAFELEALAHTDALRRLGMRLTGNTAYADDLVQETFLKAYRFWDKYEKGTNIRSWLFRILKNTFINMYRKDSREPETVDYEDTTRPEPAHECAADAHKLHALVFSNLVEDNVSEAVSGLPEDYRIVVILCDLEGLTYQEIARFVACPVGTIRSRLHRGRKLLHARLYADAKERGYGMQEQQSGAFANGAGKGGRDTRPDARRLAHG